jgi:hypothetical protein
VNNIVEEGETAVTEAAAHKSHLSPGMADLMLAI